MTEYIYSTDEQGGHWLTGEQIVRCRDCVHFVPESNGYVAHDWCSELEFNTEPDGFCAWGERRER